MHKIDPRIQFDHATKRWVLELKEQEKVVFQNSYTAVDGAKRALRDQLRKRGGEAQ